MRKLFLMAALFILCTGMKAEEAATKKRQGLEAVLRITWWKYPESAPDLVLMQDDVKIPILPDTMTFSMRMKYFGPPAAVIARRVEGKDKDKQGNPLISYVPYATVTIPSEGADLAVILIADKTGSSAQALVYDMSESVFPYGSMRVFNFTRSTMILKIQDKTMELAPGATGRHPNVFQKRQQARFSLRVREPSQEPVLLKSSSFNFFPNSRYSYFITEQAGETPNERFTSSLILENRMTVFEPPPNPVTGTEKAAGKKEKAGSTK